MRINERIAALEKQAWKGEVQPYSIHYYAEGELLSFTGLPPGEADEEFTIIVEGVGHGKS